jgi:RNA polymerase sigma factor (sigma-70 family)
VANVANVASLDPETKKSQHSKIDDELSSLTNPTIPHIAELHSILDDGAGHINADLARSIWQWENSHFISNNDDDPYPAKRFKYSTRDGLRLVDEMARSIGDGRRYPDMVQEGVVALMRCTILWDEEHSAKEIGEVEVKASFEKFARKSIEQAMTRVLSESRDNVGERLEVNLDLLKKRGVEQARRIRMGEGTDESAAVGDPQPHNKIMQPLSQALEDANPTPDEIALSDMIRHDIGDFLERKLSNVELKIVRLRFGLEENIGSSLSTKEIAETLGLDISQVQEHEESALQHLRATFEDDYIGAYLDDDHANEVSL